VEHSLSMKKPRAGILLAQIGTPDAPTPDALRRYLREFLGDPRVIEANRLTWWFVLNFIVLRRRPAESAALYRRIWTEEGSPLLVITLAQARGLQAALGNEAQVEAGMRYGNPGIPAALERLRRGGVDRLLVFPLFPQYSGTTTASAVDAVCAALARERVVPALRFVPPYAAHPAYIGALAAVAREELARLPWKPDRIVLSFHGIPRRYIENGDPYRSQAETTAGLLAAELGLAESEYLLTFQSRFGKEPWLEPYTDEGFAALGREGARRLAVICPGFTADCLETLDEIARLGKEQFQAAGGEDLRLIPSLNTHPQWIRALETIAREELGGWLEGT
jgi:ferrochelatase